MRADFFSRKSRVFSVAFGLVFGTFTALAQDHIIYNSIPKNLPGNVASEGPEAYAFTELGDGMVFKSGSGGNFQKVAVVMSDWACEHGHWYIPVGQPGACVSRPGSFFKQDITLNIYSVTTTAPYATSLIGSVTQTFNVPYRPSSDAVRCPGGDGTRWYSPQDKTCYHGLAFQIEFNLNQLPVSIPANNRAVMTIAFPTSDYGAVVGSTFVPSLRPQACNSLPVPDGDNCPYDSLNISTDSGGLNTPPTNEVYTGSFVDPDSIFVNYANPGNACDPNTTVIGALALDPGCWAGFHPEIQVKSTPRAEPQKQHGPVN